MYAISAFGDLQFFHLRNAVFSPTECKNRILRVPKRVKKAGVVCQNAQEFALQRAKMRKNRAMVCKTEQERVEWSADGEF